MSSHDGKILAAALLLVAMTLPATAQELSVVVGDEDSLLKLYAGSAGAPTYALWDTDPLSSGWGLMVDGAYTTPADGDWVRESRSTDEAYSLIYSNRDISLTQDLILSSGGTHAMYSVVIRNNGTDAVSITPVFLLDTNLGESTGLPFVLSDGTYIRNEMSFQGAKVPAWIRTEKSRAVPSLTVMLGGGPATVPESVSLANWLRLKQSGPSFIPNNGRSFDYLPFSKGDSAMMLTYETKSLGQGETYEMTLVMGLDENPPDAESFLKTIVSTDDSVRENIRLRTYTVRQRLREISRIIDSIDAMLADDEKVTGTGVAEIERKIQEQERLRAEYENL